MEGGHIDYFDIGEYQDSTTRPCLRSNLRADLQIVVSYELTDDPEYLSRPANARDLVSAIVTALMRYRFGDASPLPIKPGSEGRDREVGESGWPGAILSCGQFHLHSRGTGKMWVYYNQIFVAENGVVVHCPEAAIAEAKRLLQLAAWTNCIG